MLTRVMYNVLSSLTASKNVIVLEGLIVRDGNGTYSPFVNVNTTPIFKNGVNVLRGEWRNEKLPTKESGW